MDKNAIKKYAVWARRELIARVSQRAEMFGISKEDIGDPNADSVNGHLLSQAEKRQRQALIGKIRAEGYEQVMEEVAYTWFNRFAALRFMEVNGYLPSHVRVFTNDAGEFKPQLLAEAIHLELDGLDMNRVYELENANQSEALYKYLLIVQCNALNSILPGMFQRIEDYTELLFPDNLLREGSVIEQMVSMIPEEDWTDQVQIIGWLYQYYISEKKDKVFENLKKNIKISKENIPAATQLFTPDWIVRYMVENSLGRIFIDHRKNEGVFADGRGPEEMTHEEIEQKRIVNEKYIAEEMGWKYFLPEAEQTPEVREKLTAISEQQAAFDPTALRVIDPCCGSGHILCVLFDVLIQIYEAYGYPAREAAVKIVQNNLWGLDIDDRAAQLAYFSVMMKARQYDRRFFSRNVQPHVYAVQESNRLDADYVNYFINGREDLRAALSSLTRELFDAKEYGSILHVTPVDFDALYARFDEIADEINLFAKPVYEILLPFVRMAQALSQKYDVVVTNPPYMGAGGMSGKLSNFVKKYYPDSKSDLFAVFIERCGAMLKPNGYQAMITQHAWMFLSSFEKLRAKLLTMDTINMAHLGARAFEEIGGEVVQTTSFVLKNAHIKDYKGIYCRLIEPTTQQGKEDMFLAAENRYTANQSNFSKIPGSPVAYWVSEQVFSAYEVLPLMSSFGDLKHGMTTGDNNNCLRYWYEIERKKLIVDASNIEEFQLGHFTYVPYNKGGPYKKWYGNLDYVLGYNQRFNDYMDTLGGHRHDNPSFYFRESITWSLTNSSYFGARMRPKGSIFDVNGMSLFVKDNRYYFYLLGLMCSKVSSEFMRINNPTLASQVGDVARIPIRVEPSVHSVVTRLTRRCVSETNEDWNSFETSWDFKKHPLV